MTLRPEPGGCELDPGLAARASVVLARCVELGQISEEPGFLSRRPLTSAARHAERLVASWMRDAGGQATVDPVGNVTGRWRPSGAVTVPVIVIGSHIDTVRNAGRYDGPLGVLLGIALAETLATPPSPMFPPLPFGIDVVAFAGEEGARFSLPFLGSRMVAGDLPAELLARLDTDGVSFGQALGEAGHDPESVVGHGPSYAPGDILLYLEPHIEQGPVLDVAGEAVGVVTAIAGQTRRRVTLTG
ncbi:MAG: M28 family peptidase, partial [Chloroflexi bacterium]|nr:M28 family peptidase [Chloroflexota bacterium]